MSADQPLRVERSGAVETWILDRADRRNPISDDAMVDAVVSAVDRVGGDPDVGAVVLTGAGSAFSAGGDLRAMQDGEGLFGLAPAQQRTGYRRGIQRLTRAVVGCDVPMIAAVNGPAIGAGCDIALMCDIRLASSAAVFAESFVKLGLIPGDGGAWLLPRIVGNARAREMALTGRKVDATTAEQWGIVSAVLEPTELLPAAQAMAAEIAQLPREAVRMTKSLLRAAEDLGLDATLELSAAMQPLCHVTEEHRALLEAFTSGASR